MNQAIQYQVTLLCSAGFIADYKGYNYGRNHISSNKLQQKRLSYEQLKLEMSKIIVIIVVVIQGILQIREIIVNK